MASHQQQLLAVVCLASLWLQAAAILPTVCVKNVTNPVAICCPTPRGHALACGGRGRGECLQVQAFREYNNYNPAIAQDDRLQWPQRFFQFACQCDAKFWGPDCGECFFGWKGPNCTERDTRVRRNIFRLSRQEQDRYRQLTMMMRTAMSPYSILIERHSNTSDPLRNPVFVEATIHYWLVYVHRYASRKTLFNTREQCSKFGKLDLNHGGPGFLTWHRYYTMMLERELHKLAVQRFGWTDFALPYWDWVDATWCEVCHNHLVGAPGECENDQQFLHERSPFSDWDEFCSTPTVSTNGGCVGCHAKSKFNRLMRQWRSLDLPTSGELNFAMNLTQYYIPGEFDHSPSDMHFCSFSRMLEGHCGPKPYFTSSGTLHNKVHDSVKGSFCCASTAPNDPIFFLHHSQISRIVDLWFLKHQPSVMEMANVDTMPGHARQNYMVGFFPAIRHQDVFTSAVSLGYEYDSLEFGDHVRKQLEAEGRIPKPTLAHFRNCDETLHPQHVHHERHFREELREFRRQRQPRRPRHQG